MYRCNSTVLPVHYCPHPLCPLTRAGSANARAFCPVSLHRRFTLRDTIVHDIVVGNKGPEMEATREAGLENKISAFELAQYRTR